ncbi:DUF4136 domain-containing protein [Alcaligenes endophyticus]|uniref:DUF4136 domain-containing protein n=1 Tax=Alcaligenes endophyticus TaxID=1929088 RepID=A0ABT8EHY9_9BURK|nr:DUF4136 domain-containing protein [Alcaligenes endophyticus]MCX5592711.1 DUF4136 domain-containing protein [Alcaligenes endophyticus]MDN4120899.1 DUF4136 domain-containing protein [Alcaligenes endophyticus]
MNTCNQRQDHAFVRAFRFGVLVSLAFLTACAAPSWSAKLTRFQQWPADTMGATYSIQANPTQANNLEYLAFADMIRASIGSTGLVEAQNLSAARFAVNFDYGATVEQRWVERYRDSVYGPWGWGGGYYGMNDGWAGGLFYSPPPVVNVPVQAYKNSLTVIIKDQTQEDKEVYRAQAVSYSESDNLTLQMPYLTRAVFDDFPGNNGQVIDITYQKSRQ